MNDDWERNRRALARRAGRAVQGRATALLELADDAALVLLQRSVARGSRPSPQLLSTLVSARRAAQLVPVLAGAAAEQSVYAASRVASAGLRFVLSRLA